MNKVRLKRNPVIKLLLKCRNSLVQKHDYKSGLRSSKKPETKLSFDKFVEIFNRLEVEKEDCVLIHHSSGNLGLDFNPVRLISFFQERISDNGNIIMLAEPFIGQAFNYMKSEPVFNVEDDPCKLGIISEIFRRSDGVYRTINPISSVCVWGKNAKELVLRHKNLEYAFSNESLYGYGDQVNAKVIGLGVDVDTLSPIHYFEYLVKNEYPIYTHEKYKVKIIALQEEYDLFVHALNPAILHRWNNLLNRLALEKDSIRFIEHDRVFYSYTFSILKKAILNIIHTGDFFARI